MRDFDTAIQTSRDAVGRAQQDPAVIDYLRLLDELHTLEKARALLSDDSERSATVYRRNAAQKTVEPVADLGRVGSESSIGLAVRVLRDLGKPAHANIVFEEARKLGLKASKSTMVSNLARFTKQGKLFYRTQKRNTFGLLEWRRSAGAVNGAALEHQGR